MSVLTKKQLKLFVLISCMLMSFNSYSADGDNYDDCYVYTELAEKVIRNKVNGMNYLEAKYLAYGDTDILRLVEQAYTNEMYWNLDYTHLFEDTFEAVSYLDCVTGTRWK